MTTTKSVIIAIAAATGTSVQQECAAARQALADMKAALGEEQVYSINADKVLFDLF